MKGGERQTVKCTTYQKDMCGLMYDFKKKKFLISQHNINDYDRTTLTYIFTCIHIRFDLTKPMLFLLLLEMM